MRAHFVVCTMLLSSTVALARKDAQPFQRGVC
ncbi:MAG: hypothetical protein JWM53_2287, partial [bacterium]|nr:hypothetical protein [bacterium]